jgi:hypothetical protein
MALPELLKKSVELKMKKYCFRYNPKDKKWTLYCMPRSGRWKLYLDSDPTKNFDKLLKEVEEDGTGIFWG